MRARSSIEWLKWLRVALPVAILCVFGCGRQSATNQDSGGNKEKGGDLICDFWNEVNFSDTALTRDRLTMERLFVRFISLFPDAPKDGIKYATGCFWEKVSSDAESLKLADDIVERYMADPNSPARNEEYYISFIESQLQCGGIPDDMKARNKLRLEDAKKNRPGMMATDFAFSDSKGRHNTLHKFIAKRLMLVFYDPACSHCSEILNSLQNDESIKMLVENDELTVLAVYTEGNRELWKESISEMPRRWTIAIDESDIVDHDLYVLPAMPTIYLLDKDKRVILKDPTIDELILYLSNS